MPWEPFGEPFRSLFAAWAAFFALPFCIVKKNPFFETAGALEATPLKKNGKKKGTVVVSQKQASTLLDVCFPHTCTFYVSKTYKCQKRGVTNSYNKKEKLIHSCTFYVGKTYKCAVIVFTI